MKSTTKEKKAERLKLIYLIRANRKKFDGKVLRHSACMTIINEFMLLNYDYNDIKLFLKERAPFPIKH
jgi:hypothetical protein